MPPEQPVIPLSSPLLRRCLHRSIPFVRPSVISQGYWASHRFPGLPSFRATGTLVLQTDRQAVGTCQCPERDMFLRRYDPGFVISNDLRILFRLSERLCSNINKRLHAISVQGRLSLC